MRHELLPLLAELNPAIKEVLVRETQLLGRRQDRLEAELLRELGLNSRQIEQALDGKSVIAIGDRRIEVSAATAKPFASFDLALDVPGRAVVPGVGVVTAEAKAPLRSSQKELDYRQTDNGGVPERWPARGRTLSWMPIRWMVHCMSAAAVQGTGLCH